ncbi:MAG: dTDP-glucose 4,6-dehydratase [Candidatus Eisenbacteria bacterium]|nr:dTDP-glucose 4,6-dehydratase [Candidatus Eisenbacteria bacterium]
MPVSISLNESKLLVTGGAGFIGSNFVRHLLGKYKGVTIVVLDKLTYAGNLANLASVENDKRYSFVKGDICDMAVVERTMAGCNVVLNFAAETHVDRAIGDPGSFVTTDVYGSYVLLETAKRLGIEKFVQISTDEVYGEILGDPVKEDAQLLPRNPYSASKAGADRLAYSYYATYGLPVIITRCSNNYGPNQYPEKMIPLFVTNAMEDKPLPVYGDGKNTRDWIFVEDHCTALELLVERDSVNGEVFNIGAGAELSVLQMASKILSILNKPNSLIRFVKDRLGHDRRYALNFDKIRNATGWSPSLGFDEGLSRTVRWYLENRDWWERIKSGEFRKYYEAMYKFS